MTTSASDSPESDPTTPVEPIDGVLTVPVPRRFTSETAPRLEARLAWSGASEAVFDFAQCRFISSAGIRTVLEAHHRMEGVGGRVRVVGLSKDVWSVFEITGLATILHLERAPAELPPPREISIDGLSPFSEGVCGECFRLGPEQIVKLYREGVVAAVAEQEKQRARQAFVMGIPTAISFEMVTCRDRVGVVYEFLDAELFSEAIRREPDRVERHAAMLFEVVRSVHAATVGVEDLPLLADRLRSNIESTRGELDDADVDLLLRLLEEMPGPERCVHFDLHSSNIMLRRGEPVIIDMGDLSRGSHWFDLALIYMIYGFAELEFSELATGVPVDLGVRLWEAFAARYFERCDPADRRYFEANRHFLVSLRLIGAFDIAPARRSLHLDIIRKHLLPGMRRV